MAWQTPKTIWTPQDSVTDADMNRIEGNLAVLRNADGILLIDTEAQFVADNVEAALHELYTNTVNGKSAIASAITAMGQAASGSDTYDTLASKIRAISTDANAAVGDVLTGKTFYQGGAKRTGTMPNNGAVIITPGTTNQAIAAGYHNGSGYVKGDANLIPDNILEGKTIFGVTGNVRKSYLAGHVYGTYWRGSVPSPVTLLSITGRGTLLALYNPSTTSDVYVAMWVDGYQVGGDTLNNIGMQMRRGDLVWLLIPFTTSLLLKVSSSATLHYIYTLD